MKSAFQHKFEKFQLLKTKNDKIQRIDEQEKLLKDYTKREIKVNHARIYYAASRINSLVRGFLDRVICKKLRLERRAIELIQKVFKGKLGRIRWRKEYWRSLSIVKSDHSLKEIIERSTVVREKVIRHKRQRDHWKEMYDPLTEAFWYYNQVTKQNTWQVPVCFQTNLICHWDGYDSSGGLSSSSNVPARLFLEYARSSDYKSLPHVPCRCVFSTVPEYYNHLRTSHRWYCVACFNKNPGLTFPVCALCQNRYNEDGQDVVNELKEKIEKVQQQLQDFIDKDFSSNKDGSSNVASFFNQTVPYHIRDRLIEIAVERKETLEIIQRLITSSSSNNHHSSSVSTSSGDGVDRKELVEQIKEGYIKKLSVTYTARQQRASIFANALSSKMFSRMSEEETSMKGKLPPIPGIKLAPSPKKNRSIGKTPRSLTRTGSISNIHPPSSPAFHSTISDSENNEEVDYYSNVNNNYPPEIMNTSVTRKMQEKIFNDAGGEEGEYESSRDPITRGVFSEQDFNVITSIYDETYGDWQMELQSIGEDDDEDDESSGSQQIYSNKVRNTRSADATSFGPKESKEKRDIESLEKQFVCQDYLKGKCTKTTCSSAHPGIRDRAKISHKSFRNPDGRGRVRIPYVFICPNIKESLDDCPNKLNCSNYHRYIRPSTTDIILALYPIQSGQRIKYFPSGAKYVGNVKNDMFHGYGRMCYPDGSFYQGEWAKNIKHGYGIYSSSDGNVKYFGQFFNGKRHGWGILKNEVGDEYIGQWEDGKMCGLGILQSHNGDIYRGMFQNNHYHGIGLFIKKNGDVYLGNCLNGRADGMGILSLRSGEKYKGYFSRNARHGKGACIYANGSKYIGYWYRGVHQGFGIYVSNQKEKYVGEWAGGKKHGTGRYYFSCGDFYDGQFFKNKAKGLGVYYYANGNLFTGEWENDMKNGRGTYVFANGSKYSGNFLNNNIHGKGKFDFATGAHYRGHFDFNTKHGKGIYTWPNRNIYKGDFYREKLCGKGEMTYIAGHRYIGDWKDNRKHGYGIMYYANGAIYEGHFADDIRVGKGKLTLTPGTPVEESYEGDWEDDQWHGKGKYSYRKMEGTVYEGDWVYGVREGKGTLTFLDGSFYRGDFKRDQMWGSGIFVDGVTNTQYDGEWRANMRQGIGTSFTVDGGIYQGEWFGNMKQGRGRLYNKDGTIYDGTWDANIIIGSGKMTIKVGDEKKRDGLPKQVTVKVFGY